MHFTKLQGCGNDYVVLDGRKLILSPKERAHMAKRLCDRHFGIGADGLLIMQAGKAAEFEMEMYNPDGSRGESCGNGLRCAGKYLWDKAWTRKSEFQVETMGAVKTVERVRDELWRVSMGAARLGPVLKMSLPWGGERPLPEGEGAGDEEVFCVSMGNPHAVIFPKDGEMGEWNVRAAGPFAEKAEAFPGRTNVEFVRVKSRREIAMRVWERGAGETLSCGTGACAAAAVCMQKDLTDEEITVTLLGGELLVSKDGHSGEFFLTGPAETVFEGEL